MNSTSPHLQYTHSNKTDQKASQKMSSAKGIAAEIYPLTFDEASQSRALHGSNELSKQARKPFLKKFLSNLGDPIIRILLVALGLNLIFSLKGGADWIETGGIALAVFLATLISTLSECGSEAAFARLSEISGNIFCRVFRRKHKDASGEICELPIGEITVGDIVSLEAGEMIPADGILLSGKLKVDQSSMTGESREVEKKSTRSAITEPSPDHPSCLFRGCTVRSGEGIMQVSAVGDHTSWNFVGNPYACYYNLVSDDFASPITVWNGTTYVAYRPGDDNYHLQPYEAFFVQKTENASAINFSAEGRETYSQSVATAAAQTRASFQRSITNNRFIVNLTISDNDTVAIDRTRLVMNNKASCNYELACDASKFISEDAAAQIYTLEGSLKMAINERPGQGKVRIGYTAQKAGKLRIEAQRMDSPMELLDTKTNRTFDLAQGAYEFTRG